MTEPAVLVIDIGTSVIKTGLFDFQCRSVDRISQPYQMAGQDQGAVAELWWEMIAHSVTALSARNPHCRTAAIGLTGFMHAVVALDQRGVPLPFSTNDCGRRTGFERMLANFGAERIQRVTGSRLDVTSVPPQVLAWRSHCPSLFSKIRTVLPVKDFIRYRLTGQVATDEIDACGTMFYDLHCGRWGKELASYCSLEPEHLPPVLHCTERAGVLSPKAAQQLGLVPGIPVATGGGDDIEILGTGARNGQQVCEHVGSTGSFLLHSQTPQTDPAGRLELYPAITRGEWVLGGSCSNITRALDWFLSSSAYNCNDNINWDRIQADLCCATDHMESCRPLFLPYLHGERAPFWDPGLTGAWIGLRIRHTLPDLLLAAVEGICFSLRSILDTFADLGFEPATVHSSGGLNRLDTRRLRASLYGRPVRLVRGTDPTSFAAAALALCSIGELSDPWEAADWLQFEPDIEPEPEWQAVLNERYGMFVEQTRKMSNENRR